MSNPIKIISAITVMFALAVFFWLALASSNSQHRVDQLKTGALDPVAHAEHLLTSQNVRFPAEWVETASVLVDQSTENDAVAAELLESALAVDRYFPRGWALLAFVETRKSDRLTQSAEEALKQSIEVCPFCSKDLLRWRLAFVLEHWQSVSEETRISAFAGADLLRWWHLDYQYLSEVRADAIRRGIEFDAYRLKVDSPVRLNEIGG